MAQQRTAVKVKLSGIFAVYLQLLLIGEHQQPIFAYFETCDYVYSLNPGSATFNSPNYPNSYPSPSSCRFQFIAPLDYEISIDCTYDMEKNPSGCSTEYFFVDRDGDVQLRDAEQFCGYNRIQRTSRFRSLTLAYISLGQRGRFTCTLTTRPQPCDCGWSVNTRIANGQETLINEYPSMVAIRDRDSNSNLICGGAIISHRYVVTAAHCIRAQPDLSKLLILAGDHNLETTGETRYAASYNVQQLIIHPDYDEIRQINDIGLLRTATDIQWSRGVGPACLPFTNTPQDFQSTFVTAMGWGATSFGGQLAPALQKANQIVLTNAVCQSQIPEQVIIASHMCTSDYTGNSVDTCQSDSGGPIILKRSRQYLLGSISFGRPCGFAANPIGVNTRISSFLVWIYNQIQSSPPCVKILQ